MSPTDLTDLLADHDAVFAARRNRAMGVVVLARGAPYEWTPADDARRADVHRVVAAHFTLTARQPPPHPEVTRTELTRPPQRWTPGMAQHETELEPAPAPAPKKPTTAPQAATVADIDAERCRYVQAHAKASGLSFALAARDLEQRGDPRFVALTHGHRGAWLTDEWQ